MPRKDSRLILLAVLEDEGPTLYEQLVRGCRRSTRFALELLKEILDRQHGKARQHLVADHTLGAIFMRDDDTSLAVGDDPGGEVLAGAADLAAALMPASRPLPMQPLAVLPPPSA